MEEDGIKSADAIAEVNVGTAAFRRTGPVGDLARRACGLDGAAPDLTALVPLVDAIEMECGTQTAIEFRNRVAMLGDQLMIRDDTTHSPDDNFHSVRDFGRFLVRQVRKIVGAYLYDFNAVCLVAAELVQRVSAPPKELKAVASSVDLVRVRVSPTYGVGDQFRLPDGRRAIVVTPRDADGIVGALPCANDGPQMDGVGMSGPMEADDVNF